jgi:hypothetical protein
MVFRSDDRRVPLPSLPRSVNVSETAKRRNLEGDIDPGLRPKIMSTVRRSQPASVRRAKKSERQLPSTFGHRMICTFEQKINRLSRMDN